MAQILNDPISPSLFCQNGIYEITSTIGSGKTVTEVYIAQCADSWGIPVHANLKIGYDLVHGGKQFSLPFNTIADLKRFRYGLAIIDDATPWADARLPMSNYKIGWMASQVRKKHCIVVYSQQTKKGVDLRFRDLAHGWIRTSILEFPNFLLEFFSPDDELVFETYVCYGSEVYNGYDTDYIVSQNVELKALQDLSIEVDRRSFAYLVSARYNIPVGVSQSIYTLLSCKKLSFVEELLDSYGYSLGGSA